MCKWIRRPPTCWEAEVARNIPRFPISPFLELRASSHYWRLRVLHKGMSSQTFLSKRTICKIKFYTVISKTGWGAPSSVLSASLQLSVESHNVPHTAQVPCVPNDTNIWDDLIVHSEYWQPPAGKMLQQTGNFDSLKWNVSKEKQWGEMGCASDQLHCKWVKLMRLQNLN